MPNSTVFSVLGGEGHHDLDKHIVKVLNDLGHQELKFHHLAIDNFADGEEDTQIVSFEDLEGKHLLLFQSVYSQELMIEFLQLAWACKKQYGVKSITAIVAFMRYRRQDHDELNEEITRLRWLIDTMGANGVDRILFCDIHSDKALKFCTEAGMESYNVIPSSAFSAALQGYVDIAKDAGRRFIVYAPDEGAVVRSIDLAREMGNAKVVMTLKKRDHRGDIVIYKDLDKVAALAEEHGYPLAWADKRRVKGASVVIRDDELSTGDTARKTGWHAKDNLGAFETFFCATHAICAPGWTRKFLKKSSFKHAFLANPIPRGYRKSTGGKATTVIVSRVMGNRLLQIMQGVK